MEPSFSDDHVLKSNGADRQQATMGVIPAPIPWADKNVRALLTLLCQAYEEPDEVRHLVEQVPQSAEMISVIGFDASRGISKVWQRVLKTAVAWNKDDALFARLLADEGSTAFHAEIEQLLVAVRDAPSRLSLRSSPRDLGTLGESREAVLDKLREIEVMSGLPDDSELVRLLWTSAIDVGPIPMTALVDIYTVLDLLDSRLSPGRQRMPPVLAFLEYLAAHTGAPERLHVVINEIAERLDVDWKERARVRENAGNSTLDIDLASVFVQLSDEDGQMRPQLWLYRPDATVSFKQEAGAPCGHDDVRAEVQQLISKVTPLLRGLPPRNLRFEFVLPFTMFNVAVDEWSFDDGREIGLHSQVVIRSLDRLRHPLSEHDWERRSADLGDLGDVPPEKLARLSTTNAPTFRGLTELDPLVFLTLVEAFQPPQSWLDPDELLDAIKGGLPGALWYRKGGDPAALLALVLDAAAAAGLKEMPSEVLRLRQEAHGASPTDLRRHISLFWDDFHSRPVRPGALRTPRTRGGTR